MLVGKLGCEGSTKQRNLFPFRSDSSSPLQAATEIDDNWCRHCDKRHLEGRNVGCPLTKPLVVVSDAVIDFSAIKETELTNEVER